MQQNWAWIAAAALLALLLGAVPAQAGGFSFGFSFGYGKGYYGPNAHFSYHSGRHHTPYGYYAPYRTHYYYAPSPYPYGYYVVPRTYYRRPAPYRYRGAQRHDLYVPRKYVRGRPRR